MDPLQFYPNTPALAAKAVAKFRNRRFDCVIDPSAGTGDFLKAVPRSSSARQTRLAIEIDVQKHAALREKGIAVIGYDFFDCACLAQASHIVLNPPFRNGAEHVLRA